MPKWESFGTTSGLFETKDQFADPNLSQSRVLKVSVRRVAVTLANGAEKLSLNEDKPANAADDR